MTRTATPLQPFKGFSATALYFTDNGATYCGSHLGTSARCSGRDISGQKILRVTEADREYARKEMGFEVACEACRAGA